MNRNITNKIRFILDELVPPILRDSKGLMYPVYFIFMKGKIPAGYIEYKSKAYDMTERELEEMYNVQESYGQDRVTDLTASVVEFIFPKIELSNKTLLDVGCGKGYFMKLARARGFDVSGCDNIDRDKLGLGEFSVCSVEKLPFKSNSFDVVTCHHTLEHVRDIRRAVAEVIRVAKYQIVVTVPCQRFYKYTIDLHLNFFPTEQHLINLFGIKKYYCERIGGDLVYIGWIKQRN